MESSTGTLRQPRTRSPSDAVDIFDEAARRVRTGGVGGQERQPDAVAPAGGSENARDGRAGTRRAPG